jgi:glycosyltransferase involved in cell wall biosynthesis
MKFSTVILTYNSEATIGNTIESIALLCDDIHVVDSYSSDHTCDLVRRYGVRMVQHPFTNYAAQRNWAIGNLPLNHEWELHLDADERVSEQLSAELSYLKEHDPPAEIYGYCVPRLVHFLGRPLRHGGMFPIWHTRLFRRGYGRCEDREYDQHFLVQGQIAKLYGAIVDDMRMSLTEWVVRHNRWSDAEVRELLRGANGDGLRARLTGNPLERKRRLRNAYNHGPLFIRAAMLFFYRYFLRLGFLDGTEGLIFYFLQTFWFRFLVDAKLFEQRRKLATILPASHPKLESAASTRIAPSAQCESAPSPTPARLPLD